MLCRVFTILSIAIVLKVLTANWYTKRNSEMDRYLMKNVSRAVTTVIAGLCLYTGIGMPVYMQQTNSPVKNAIKKGEAMTTHASGTFDVKVTPQTNENSGDPLLGRMSIDKQLHGDLEGTSKGEMLTGMSAVTGSGAYVAIEKVSGKLNGRSGTFILQHSGTMTRGKQHLIVTVVPDSGTGELAGLEGTFTINIDNGKHSYEFAYTLTQEKKD
jgi:hypothetical protein